MSLPDTMPSVLVLSSFDRRLPHKPRGIPTITHVKGRLPSNTTGVAVQTTRSFIYAGMEVTLRFGGSTP